MGTLAARMAGLIAALAAATLLAAELAIISQSQFVLAGLRGLGAPIGAGETLRFTLADIAGMTPTYLLALTPAFLIAFAVTAWLQPRTPIPRAPAFAIGGGAAVVVLLLGMFLLDGSHLVAGSRGLAGMAFQGAAGAAGGLLFARLTRRTGLQAGRATPV
ncbi:MAG: hypothetical protein AB7O49_03080 [Sphingomonadales bacterium]